MITLFHRLTIVKVLGIVSLSFSFPMCVKQMQNGSHSEIVSLFHTIVKVLGIVGLSFRFPMCVKQMQNGSHPCRKLKLR